MLRKETGRSRGERIKRKGGGEERGERVRREE